LPQRAASDWSARQLFRIVRNGQKYTGMPAWIAAIRDDDEVLPVVAFPRRVPDLDAAFYRELAGLGEGHSAYDGLEQERMTEFAELGPAANLAIFAAAAVVVRRARHAHRCSPTCRQSMLRRG